MPRIYIPTQMRSLTGVVSHVDVEAGTVREAIQAVDRLHPGIADALLEDNLLRRGLAVAIDGSVTPRGALASLAGAREVHFLPAIGGG